MWRGWTDTEFVWWCVSSWEEIQMVYRSMRNDLRVADELYIKRVWLALENFLFISLYSFSCIAKQVTTLKQLRLLSCPDFLETNLEPLSCFLISHIVTNSTYAQPHPLHMRVYIMNCYQVTETRNETVVARDWPDCGMQLVVWLLNALQYHIISITIWESIFEDTDNTIIKTRSIDVAEHILVICWNFMKVFGTAKWGHLQPISQLTMEWIWGPATIFNMSGFTIGWSWVQQSWVEWSGMACPKLGGIWSLLSKAGLLIWI